MLPATTEFFVEINATIFVQVFIFLTLLLGLSRWLFNPILALMDEREKRVFGAKKEAEKMNALAKKKSQEFEDEYEKARDSARHSLSDLKNQTDREQLEIMENIRSQARQKIEQARIELLEQEKNIKQELPKLADTVMEEMLKALVPKNA